MIPYITFIAGLLIGFYGWNVYSKVRYIYEAIKDHYDSPAGVVKPEVAKITKHQPINLESETGGVMRLSPDEIALQNLKEREARVRNL